MIFYLSCTGNSRWAASKLAAATREQLVFIADYMRNGNNAKDLSKPFILKEGERLGFVFPVHGWKVPKLVRSFLEKAIIKSSSGEHPYTYAVCTAGDNIGLTMEELDKCLSANDSLKALDIEKTDASYSLIMPESYVGLPFMDVDPKDREIRKKNESAKRLEIICEEVFDKKQDVQRLDTGNFPWINSKIIGNFFEKYLITDKRFHVESDRCVKCGICANVCPVDNIIGGKGLQPIWRHNDSCLTCFACYHHCPHHAIEFGKQTQKKGQYFFK